MLLAAALVAGIIRAVGTVSDCQSCGACCFSDTPTYVRLSGDDWSRLGDVAERVAHFIGNRAYLRMEAGHCAALRIEPSQSGGGLRFACEIYDRRPQVCRDLERGSPQCAAERTRKGTLAAAITAPRTTR